LSDREAREVEVRVEVTPPWPLRLARRGTPDGVMRCSGGVLERLLHRGEEQVVVKVAQSAAGAVLFGAHARSREAAHHGIARMRFALGVDDDLRAFHRRFSRDPLIGRSLRSRPWLRVTRRPEPFEALAWAICEQLIEFERAAAIERRLVRALGRRRELGEQRGRAGMLRDLPAAGTLAGTAPALLESFDLAGARARTLVRAAKEVARGHVDLHAHEHERAWTRLRAIPGVGPWTVEMMALHGQGRYDQLPAGDLGLLELVGRAMSGGDPRARASEAQVRDYFAPYGEWAGLAWVHMMGHAATVARAL
jgi:3-methyladenine DNA glycosylase/8-oxoguanine DNA glycosylase